MDGIDGSDYPSPYPVDQRGALSINSIDYRRFGTDPRQAHAPHILNTVNSFVDNFLLLEQRLANSGHLPTYFTSFQ
jgi:hypothetical protein